MFGGKQLVQCLCCLGWVPLVKICLNTSTPDKADTVTNAQDTWKQHEDEGNYKSISTLDVHHPYCGGQMTQSSIMK